MQDGLESNELTSYLAEYKIENYQIWQQSVCYIDSKVIEDVFKPQFKEN